MHRAAILGLLVLPALTGQHRVVMTWQGAGPFQVWRSGAAGGELCPSCQPLANTTVADYVDYAVSGGQHVFYVVTNSGGSSNEVACVVPKKVAKNPQPCAPAAVNPLIAALKRIGGVFR